MRQWIVSLGAGKEQIPLLRAIQSEGYACLAFDKDREAAGKSETTIFKPVSNRDIGGMLNAIECPENVAGVMAAASEVPDVMAILAHRLRLSGIPVAAGMLLRDKLRYKEVLKAAGVPHTEAHPVYRGCAKTIFDQLGYEVVVKPQRGSGSRGVSIVRHAPMQLELAYAEAEGVWHDVIMERYQPGPQISSESLIWDGTISTPAFVDRFYEDGSLKELGGSMPSEWSKEEPYASSIILQAARALGISRGTVKCDLVLTEDGPKIIEMTARLSGGPLASIVKQSTGIDYFKQAVRIAVGKGIQWECMTPRCALKVAVDMNGNPLIWADTRRFIQKELGKCRR